ncbi:hypothetical protein MmiHf6_15080 [Methanimicrococcus hongohii]|uniref:Uncharacterized protein n=1 Tax=Methanimicrococcus hongohii TaxID=3028295 RepID=A0AA96V0P8_9EURY|nr:hypothetical protein [Methanimicrococcus sp. Hf6]WNY24179.1 hypothetical protein MmiHf6_15080 [Methanimicrococcus sp. Hf6]
MDDRDMLNATSQTLIVPIKICKNVIKGLLLFAGALIIGIGYFTALAFFAVGISAIVIGFMNYTAGAGNAFLFAFGGGLLALSFTAPLIYVSNHALREFIDLNKKTINEFKKGVQIEVE